MAPYAGKGGNAGEGAAGARAGRDRSPNAHATSGTLLMQMLYVQRPLDRYRCTHGPRNLAVVSDESPIAALSIPCMTSGHKV